MSARTTFGVGNFCHLVYRYYLTGRPTWWLQNGQNVTLNSTDIKFSYLITNCSIVTHLETLYSVPRASTVVVGRTGGVVLDISVLTPTGSPLPNYNATSSPVPITIGNHWMYQCYYNESVNSAPYGPLRGIWPSFDFGERHTIDFQLSTESFEYTLRLVFLIWGYSENTSYVSPYVSIYGNQLRFQIVNDTLIRTSVLAIVRQEYFTSAEYDPTLSFLFGGNPNPGSTQPPSESSNSGGSPGLSGSYTPQNLTEQQDAKAAIIGGAVAGSIVAAAVIIFVLAVVLSKSLRTKVMPFSTKRSEMEPLAEIDEADSRAGGQTRSGSSWTRGTASSTAVKTAS
jgi:hypothetical protein